MASYTKQNFQDGDVLHASQLNSMDAQIYKNLEMINTINDLVNSTPKLTYVSGMTSDNKTYYSVGDQMRLMFNFTSSSAGKCTITILRNGYAFKTITVNKGLISVDLGTAATVGSYVYTVSGVDSLGRDADDTITFNHVVGGVVLESTFANVIKSTVFSANVENNITIPYSISYPEDGYERSIKYTIKNSTGTSVFTGTYLCGTSDKSSEFTMNGVIFNNPGKYQLELQGRVMIGSTALLSTPLVFTFSAIQENSIAIAVLNTLENITSNTAVSISYRITTNVSAVAIQNGLAAKCYLYYINNGEEVLIKSVRATNLTTGDERVWNIGRMSTSGTYKFRIDGEPLGGSNSSINSQYAEGTFDVAIGETVGSNYETAGLIAYFDPNDMDNDDVDPSVWKAKNSLSSSYYYFKLHDLNYRKNGWIVDQTDGSKMLKFTGDSYGELRYVDEAGNDRAYSPMDTMTSSSMGNSLEVVFKTRCVGVTDAAVVSCRNETITNYGRYSIYYDRAKISSNIQNAEVNLVEDKETHIVFVIDKGIRELGTAVTNDNIEDMNPVCTMNIYVNGVRTKVISMSDNEGFANTSAYPNFQMILNAYYDAQNRMFTGFGECEIKTIRLYSTALKASQVLNNYINSKYDGTARQKLISKNDASKADIPIVRFVRNQVRSGGTVSYGKFSVDKSFATLNSITLKSSKDPNVATSKNSWVNCTMWYTYLDADGLWQTVHYDDVDVYLQGTSSLQYPVKNYKIKLYGSNPATTTRGSKKKIIPPNKGDKDGWHVKESTFTLKCDYMEESHKNNTPTAMMYEDILDTVMASGVSSDYTPAKRADYSDCYVEYEVDDGTGNTTTVRERKYRDAIAGFPILLYYNENNAIDPVTGEVLDYNELSSDDDGYYVNNSDTMVGTLMFNVDKTDDTLGFKIPAEEYTVKVGDEDATYTDGTPFTMSIKPCVSLEGTSNSARPSAASFYTVEEANKYTYEEDYLRLQYNAMSITDSYEKFYTDVQSGLYTDVYTYTQYCELDDTGIFKNVYDYISATFEPRWVYTEESLASGKKLSDATYNELTYGNIKRVIDWLATSYNNKTKFRNEFEQYFNLGYCITYYLQMMMFIQVDNAGKNAMFDEWGDGILYPRPYDMDTQMGENNSGDDVIHCSAEINPDLSPRGITGTYAGQASASNSETDLEHTRYIDYNTPNSRLWLAFGKHFRTEIVAAYTKLRNDGIYGKNYIVSTVNGLTSDIIGESFYNKDAAAKYLTQTRYVTNSNGTVSISDAMLTKLQGNRDSRYEQIVEQRIIFLDTFFGYTQGDTINKSITIRSDAVSAGNSNVQIGISVYSPCYITIQVGTDATICAFIDNDASYTYGANTYEGVLFNLPIVANNKDIVILGAGNIKSINHMENLVVTNFICEEAKKITSIVITNSTALASLSLGSNTYLRTLNLAGSKTLSGSLMLNNCLNLREVDISGTAVSSVTIPEGGNLKSFVAENCKLTTLAFNDLQFLDTIDIDGCTTIVSYSIESCPLITEINTNGMTSLSRVVVSNCDNVQSLLLNNTNISEMSITSCGNVEHINLSGCNGSIMSNLNLSTVYGLKNLNISSSQPGGGVAVYFPLYKKEYASKTDAEIQALIDDGVDVYWRTLTTFNANSSTLKNIVYGIRTNVESGLCDFSQLTNLASLDIKNCLEIKSIVGIKYSGNLASLFYNDRNVESIQGGLTSTGSSMSRCFSYCYKLNDLSGLTLNLSSITDAAALFYGSNSINYATAKSVLDKMPNVTNLGSFLYSTEAFDLTGSDLFAKTTKVTNLSWAFGASKVTNVPSGIFAPIKGTLTNAERLFSGASMLKTVANGIFKQCSALNSLRCAFSGCVSLETLFTAPNYYDIFPEQNTLKNTLGLFSGCSKLKPATYATGDPDNGLKKMFWKLGGLTNAEMMFYGTTFITGIPNGIFSENKNLVEIDAAFAMSTGITELPGYLFSNQGASVTTHPALIGARGLFSGCEKLSGTISGSLLHGANNLVNIGNCNGYSTGGSSPGYYYTGGMFANTAIIGYAHNFLSHLTKLQNVAFLFFKGSCTTATMIPSDAHKNSGELSYVYIGIESYPQRIYHGIFYGLTALKDARYCFAGNTSLHNFVDVDGSDVNSLNTNGNVEANIFRDCKGTLMNAEGLFARCRNLETKVSSTLFKNCSALTTVKSCYAMCDSLNGSLPGDFLAGCTSLLYANYMFYGCSNLGADDAFGDISVYSSIFDSCRAKISNVAYMFAGCGFRGKIQTGAGEIVIEDGISRYEVSRNGLLAECTKLTSAEGMFMCCYDLKGAVPEDIFFTSDSQTLYMNLTNIAYMFAMCIKLSMNSSEFGIDGRNKITVYGEDNQSSARGYFIPRNWLSRCPNITDISYIFNHVSNQHESWVDSNFTVGLMDMDDLVFSQQTKIQSARNAFSHCKSMNASLSSVFMQNCLNSLSNVERMFAFSNLKQAGSQMFYSIFEKNSSTTAKNTAIVNVAFLLYRAFNNGMTGYAPVMSRMPNVTSSNCMVYNQTGLSNYSSYTANQKNSASYDDRSDENSLATYNISATLS